MLHIFWMLRRLDTIKARWSWASPRTQNPECHVHSGVIGSSCCKPYGPLSYRAGFPKSSLNSSWTIGQKTWLFLIRSTKDVPASHPTLEKKCWQRETVRELSKLCCWDITLILPGKLVLPQLNHTWRLWVWTSKPRAHFYVALTWPAHIKENVILMMKNMRIGRAR